MASHRISRRRFLASASAAAAVTGTGVQLATGAVGANETIGVALIGCGGQGRHDLRMCYEAGEGNVQLLAACDPDPMHSDHTRGEMREKHGHDATEYKDYREVLDRKDVDIVIVGTPDHWHAPVVIAACDAGKDVYVEKPCSHTILEGRQMVKAARKNDRIVQVGQQQRSDPHFIEAVRYVQGSNLGRIARTMTMYTENVSPDGMGHGGSRMPDRITEQDYDLWLGAAPKREFNSNRWHSKWRWFFDYAGGIVGDWNVHVQDIVHWAMKVDAPRSVVATGLKTLNDNRETPDTIEIVYEFEGPGGPFFQRFLSSLAQERGQYPQFYGTEFYGQDGALFVNRSFWEVKPGVTQKSIDDPDNPGKRKTVEAPRIEGFRKVGHDDVKYHMKNFLDAVGSRKRDDQACDIEVGHRVATACHLGNISYRLGRKIWWDAEKETIVTQDGRPDNAANAWLTKEYREGYELPKA